MGLPDQTSAVPGSAAGQVLAVHTRLRAEAELEEARAFSRGRIAPRYVAGYVGVILLSLFGLAVLVDAIVPGLIPGNPLAAMRDFSAAGADWLASVMDF